MLEIRSWLVICAAIAIPLAAMQDAPLDAPNPLYERAYKLLEQQKLKQAKKAFLEAVETIGSKPEAIEGLVTLGIMAFHEKDLVKAEGYLTRAESINPSQAAKATLWMGLVRDRQQRYPEAETYIQSAMAQYTAETTDLALANEIYAYLLQKLGRNDEAKVMLVRAAEIRRRLEPAVRLQVKHDYPPAKKGDGTRKPKLLSRVEPRYTDEARATGYGGTVVVEVEILPDGTARNIQVVRGLGFGLTERAIEALSQWRFQPGTRAGQPVSVAATIELNFRLL